MVQLGLYQKTKIDYKGVHLDPITFGSHGSLPRTSIIAVLEMEATCAQSWWINAFLAIFITAWLSFLALDCSSRIWSQCWASSSVTEIFLGGTGGGDGSRRGGSERVGFVFSYVASSPSAKRGMFSNGCSPWDVFAWSSDAAPLCSGIVRSLEPLWLGTSVPVSEGPRLVVLSIKGSCVSVIWFLVSSVPE